MMSKLNGLEQPFVELLKRLDARKAEGYAPDRRYESDDYVFLADVAAHDPDAVTKLADDLRQETGNRFHAIYMLDRVREEMELGSQPRLALEEQIHQLRLGSDRMRFRMACDGQLQKNDDAS